MKISTKKEKLYQATITVSEKELEKSLLPKTAFKEIDEKVSRVVLELTPLEAGALNALLGKVGGTGYLSIRRFYNELFTKTMPYRSLLSEELSCEKDPYGSSLLIGPHPDFKNYNPDE